MLFDVVFTDCEVRTYRDLQAADHKRNALFNAVLRENGVFKSPGKVYPCLALTETDFRLTESAVEKAARAVSDDNSWPSLPGAAGISARTRDEVKGWRHATGRGVLAVRRQLRHNGPEEARMSDPSEESARLTLRGIEVFVAVIEEGSFGGGARRLRASPSAVSQQIANLESALGARLIERAARPLVLTPAGSLFQRRALALLDEAARARAELAALELAALPQLRLAIIEDLDGEATPDLVARLAAKLPGCLISVHSGPSHENIAALEGRAVDIVVAADQDDPPDWIERHSLLRDPYVLFTARDLLAGADDVLAGLATAPMIRYSSGLLMGRQIERHLRRLRLAPPRRFELDSSDALLATVARLRGWALGTPLCWLRAPRFHAAINVSPLPFRGFSRKLSLLARRGSLGAMPQWMAAALRELLALHFVEAGLAAMPWLDGQLRIIEAAAPPDPLPAVPVPAAFLDP